MAASGGHGRVAPAVNRTLTAAGTREARHHHVRWREHRTALSSALLGAALLATDLTAPFSAVHLPTATITPRATAATTAQAGPCVAGWSEQPIPGEAFISTPFEILTHDEQPAWILGGANSGVLALRWDGSTWVRSATSTRGHQGLVGGDVIGARKVLAVGYKRPTRGEGDGSLLPISGQITGAYLEGPHRSRPARPTRHAHRRREREPQGRLGSGHPPRGWSPACLGCPLERLALVPPGTCARYWFGAAGRRSRPQRRRLGGRLEGGPARSAAPIHRQGCQGPLAPGQAGDPAARAPRCSPTSSSAAAGTAGPWATWSPRAATATSPC